MLLYDTRSPTMHDSCKNYPKMPKFCRENYVNTCPQQHMESGSVFIERLTFIYIHLMNHYPSLSYSSLLTSHNKPKSKT